VGRKRNHKKNRGNKMNLLGSGNNNTPRPLKIIDYARLKEVCQMKISDFEQYGEVTQTDNGVLIYRDNGASLLAVAHLDTVIENNMTFYQSGDNIYAPQLDDRLGAYIILDLLPKMGINVDILLTEGEESGRSTAQHFVLPEGKSYNWMMEFDRMGKQTVMYQYETAEMRAKLKEFDIGVGSGSFTDICYLGSLKIWGVNFAIAYSNNHSVNSHFDTKALEEELLPKYQEFIKANENIKYEYSGAVTGKTRYAYGGYGGYSGWDDWDDKKSYKATSTYVRPTTSKWFGRYTWNYQQKTYCCNECGKTYLVCTGVQECIYKAKQPKTECMICRVGGCKGYTRCVLCEFNYHNNKTVKMFDMCRCCLHDILGVPWKMLDDLDSMNVAVKQVAEADIRTLIKSGIDVKENVNDKAEC
jgi:hypothetical protein